MSFFFQFLITGAVAGSLYAIIASSLVLTYTTSGVFNFAQGGTAFLTALVYYELNSGLGWPIGLAAVVSVLVFAPCLGLVLDRLVFRGLSKASEVAKIVATVALGVALPAIGIFLVDRAINVFGWDRLVPAENVVAPPGLGPTPPEILHLSKTVVVDTNQLATLAAATVCAVLLWFVVRRTRLGLQMRAVVDRRDLASIKGVDPTRTSAVAWMLSTMLAGLAGVLAAPILALGPGSFTLLMMVGATAAVFGALRSIPIAYCAGLGLGVIQNLVAGYIDPEIDLRGLSSAVPYILLFVGLLMLLRDRRRQGGVVADESPPSGLLDERPTIARGVGWSIATVALVVYTLFIADPLWVGLVAAGLALGLVFMSFTVVTGIGGMVSLAQATFVTAAGLTAGRLLYEGVPFLFALLGGVVVAAVIGTVVALPALRLGGVALGLATFAVAFVADLMVFQIDDLRNGNFGWAIGRPVLDSFDGHDDKALAMLTLAIVLVVVWLVRGLQRSASGRAAMAMRSSGVGAAASGISPAVTKLSLFAVSAAIAGLGGVMYVTFQGHISNVDFPPSVSLVWLAVVVLFGVRRPGFAVVAGLAFSVLPQILQDSVTTSPRVPEIIFGLGAIGLARTPDGWMSAVASDVARLWRRWRAGTAVVPAEPGVGVRTAVAGSPGVNGAAAATEAAPVVTPAAGEDLVVTGVRAGYDGVEVLHGVDLVVAPGSIVTVLGPNGAGKSTLCNVIAGLVPVSAGTVAAAGRDITTTSAHTRSRWGLRSAPEARGVFPGLTVEENLRLTLRGRSEREAVYERFPLLGAASRLRRRGPVGRRAADPGRRAAAGAPAAVPDRGRALARARAARRRAGLRAVRRAARAGRRDRARRGEDARRAADRRHRRRPRSRTRDLGRGSTRPQRRAARRHVSRRHWPRRPGRQTARRHRQSQ